MIKKKYIELKKVAEFISEQDKDIRLEYNAIVDRLECNGFLNMPFGEKVRAELFTIRVIQSGNIRVFYVYGKNDFIYGIYGYVKKTRTIPDKDMKQALKVASMLKQEGLI